MPSVRTYLYRIRVILKGGKMKTKKGGKVPKRFAKLIKMDREFRKDPEFMKDIHEFVKYHTS